MQTVIGSMMERNEGQGGNVLVTGATSSIRGREGFAGFAASKSGLRAACQSVAKEFGPKVRNQSNIMTGSHRLMHLSSCIEHSRSSCNRRRANRIARGKGLSWPAEGTSVSQRNSKLIHITFGLPDR